MRFALLNPVWTFGGSIYFGCREPHLPLEYGYSKALLERTGHEAAIIDGQLGGFGSAELLRRVAAYEPDIIVVTTAPSYLFWRCAPPELRVPQQLVRALRQTASAPIVVVGPHASSTPSTTLRKLGADAAIIGECEDILPQLAVPIERWKGLPSLCVWIDGEPHATGPTHATDVAQLPALTWSDEAIAAHRHHHHRFDATPAGPGAEMEASRGCPYHCSFCAKDNFRNSYRKRPLAVLTEEIDRFLAQGVEYLYFIDEIFLPNRDLLRALVGRNLKFGVQTRIDLWSPEMLDLLGLAGCVSIEAGVESISALGRNLLDKDSRLSTAQITERLVHARKRVPFVQANLIDAAVDDEEAVEQWRAHLQRYGVWANKPVPLFRYPGSPDYTKRWGAPDDAAWERALNDYLAEHDHFSDIQDDRPLTLEQLELMPAGPPNPAFARGDRR